MATFGPVEGNATRGAWGVAALLRALADTLASRFAAVTVVGELSGWTRATSGHCYVTLKDADGEAALVRCAVFRRAAALLDFEPRDGMRVEVRGRVALYDPRGELQLVIESMRRLGAGALYEEFLRLRQLLERQGLFDPTRKRRLPSMPRRVAVVTSPGAAAWHDVMAAFQRRSPQVEVVLVASPVQGGEAPAALVSALSLANRLEGVDTVVLVRGGGSLEDLWSFNDERVVRAVAQSARPLVCGVGHETDVTLCDLAADLRAPTPTAAAELAAPAATELAAALERRQRLLQQGVLMQLDRQAQRLDATAARLGPAAALLAVQQERLASMFARLRLAATAVVSRKGTDWQARRDRWIDAAGLQMRRCADRLEAKSLRLQSLDPTAVLSRGFVWVEDAQGRPVLSASAVSPGDDVRAVWRDGAALARIESVDARGTDGAMGIASGTGKPAEQP